MKLKGGNCPKCGHSKFWSIRRKRRKCCKCKREYSSSWGNTCVPHETWRELTRCFLGGERLPEGLKITGLKKYRYLSAMKEIRSAILSYFSRELDGWGDNDFYTSYLIATLGTKSSLVKAYIAVGGTLTNFDEDNMVNKIILLTPSYANKLETLIKSNTKPFLSPIYYEREGRLILEVLLTDDDDPDEPTPTDRQIRTVIQNAELSYLFKKCIYNRKGLNEHNFHSYVAEIVWKRRNKKKSQPDKIHSIMKLVQVAGSMKKENRPSPVDVTALSL